MRIVPIEVFPKSNQLDSYWYSFSMLIGKNPRGIKWKSRNAILICSGSNLKESFGFENQRLVFSLPIPLLILYFQFRELQLRHYGDRYSNFLIGRIMFANLCRRVRKNPTLFLYRLLIIKIVVVRNSDINLHFKLLSSQTPINNRVWVSRSLSISAYINYDERIRDFFDLEDEKFASLVIWRAFPRYLKPSRDYKMISEIHKLTHKTVLKEDLHRLLEVKELKIETIPLAQIFGGRQVVAEGTWKPNYPYEVLPKSLPSRGLVLNSRNEIEIQTPSAVIQLYGIYFFSVVSSNYYHFLIEDLPKLLLSKDEIGHARPWLMLDSTPAQIKSIIRRVFEAEVQEMKWHQSASAHNLLFIRDFRYDKQVDVESAGERNIFLDRKNDIMLVRETLLTHFGSTRIDKPITPRLFLTRQNWQERTPVDIADMEFQYRGLGFELFDAGESSIGEQVEAFRNANQVVALAGASLANIMFCKPGTKVEVICMTDKAHDRFWQDYAELFDLEVEIKRP